MKLTSAETHWRRLIVRWTASKSFAAILLFFLITLIFEILLVYSFHSFGLVDFVLTMNFQIPYVNYFVVFVISPLSHFLPLSVIIVLLSSWEYLTKYTALVPLRIEPIKRVSAPTRHVQKIQRLKPLRNSLKRLNRKLQRVSRGLKAGFKRIRGTSYLSQRLFLAHATVRSAVTVLSVFLVTVFLLLIAEVPDLIHASTLNLYRSSPVLLNFVLGVRQWLNGVGQAVPPLSGLVSATNKALVRAAPGFRHSLESFGASLTRPIVELDLLSKYVLTQNLAAWVSALVALTYGAYVSSQTRRLSKGVKK
jgi:hypothetical protein